MSIKYNIDKEKGKLVAIRPKPPKLRGYSMEDKSYYDLSMKAYEKQLSELPPPITYSPEFIAYSETKTGPYEAGVDFFLWPDFDTPKEREYRGAVVAYPIQKAEPAPDGGKALSKKKQKKIDLLTRRIKLLNNEIEGLQYSVGQLENELFYIQHPECNPQK